MRSRRWRWLRTVTALLVLVFAIEYGVAPSLLAARHDLSALSQVTWWALVVAAVLETGALACFTCLSQTLLQGRTLGFGTQWRIDLAGYGLSHVVPAGAAGSAALRVRLMSTRGVRPRAAFAMIAVQGGWSVFGLLLVWSLGILMALPRTGPTVTGVVLALASAAAVGATLLARADPRTLSRRVVARAGAAASSRIPRRWLEPLRSIGESAVRSVRDTDVARAAMVWSVVNWFLDAACLWVCLAAYGARMPIEVVLSAYGLANVLGLVPLTPGGIGVVEGVLVPVLTAGGVASAAAVLGVLTWRAIQFWAPVPVGAVCGASLGAGPRAPAAS